MYKFTVAIPTYNSSSYLKQCIHGFKNSKFVDEIIVGDDFSDIDEQRKIIEIIKDAKDKIDCDIKLLTNQKKSAKDAEKETPAGYECTVCTCTCARTLVRRRGRV